MRFVWPLIMLFLTAALFAQGLPGEEGLEDDTAIVRPFPLAMVLEEVEFSHENITWQPDWPLYLPPDAFKPVSKDWLSISVEFEEMQYSVRRSNGQLQDFPFVFDGSLVQVRLEYDSDTEKDRLKFIFLGEDVSLEVLDYFDGQPSLIRVFRENLYSFVILNYGTGIIRESWFDQDGTFLEFYEYLHSPEYKRITEYKSVVVPEEGRRSFDSRYLITEIRNNDGIFSVHYLNEDIPRYWHRQLSGLEAKSYTLQWDRNGLLVRLEEQTSGGTDSRYEYVFDSRGNWIERQEIKMIANNGLLIPAPGNTVKRIIEYGEYDE
jgi:hypothetical protein